MTKKEFAVFADRVKTAYPKDNLLATKDMLDWWYELLGDMPYEAAICTLKQYALSNRYAPTVADIRETATRLLSGRLPEADEAWGELNRAIRRYGYMRETEALESLSEPVRRTVERIGFQNLCQSPQNEMNTLKAQFRGAYEAEYRRASENRRYPERLQLEIQGNRLKLEEKQPGEGSDGITGSVADSIRRS